MFVNSVQIHNQEKRTPQPVVRRRKYKKGINGYYFHVIYTFCKYENWNSYKCLYIHKYMYVCMYVLLAGIYEYGWIRLALTPTLFKTNRNVTGISVYSYNRANSKIFRIFEFCMHYSIVVYLFTLCIQSWGFLFSFLSNKYFWCTFFDPLIMFM